MLAALFLEVTHLNTTRNKRWNGKIDTLKPDYLAGVIGQMEAYGDRVQFSLLSPGQRPNYQVINTAGKKMAFDSNNHLLHPQEHEFVSPNATGVFTLDQIKTAMAGGGRSSTPVRATRSSVGSSSGAPRTAAARARDQIDIEKYEYFKANRQALPEGINEYSNQITDLMKKGMQAKDAFDEVIKLNF